MNPDVRPLSLSESLHTLAVYAAGDLQQLVAVDARITRVRHARPELLLRIRLLLKSAVSSLPLLSASLDYLQQLVSRSDRRGLLVLRQLARDALSNAADRRAVLAETGLPDADVDWMLADAVVAWMLVNGPRKRRRVLSTMIVGAVEPSFSRALFTVLTAVTISRQAQLPGAECLADWLSGVRDRNPALQELVWTQLLRPLVKSADVQEIERRLGEARPPTRPVRLRIVSETAAGRPFTATRRTRARRRQALENRAVLEMLKALRQHRPHVRLIDRWYEAMLHFAWPKDEARRERARNAAREPRRPTLIERMQQHVDAQQAVGDPQRALAAFEFLLVDETARRQLSRPSWHGE